MIKNIIYIYCLLLILNYNLSNASVVFQTSEESFERIDVNSGLSQNTVHSIYKGISGFMWFATADGLNRFNGYDIDVFRNSTSDSGSISNNFINCIFKEENKGFWIGTDKGLNFYNSKTGKFHRFLEGLNIKFESGENTSDKNLILAGSSPAGYNFYHYNLETKQFGILQLSNDKPFRERLKVKKDKIGNIWLLGLRQLYKYNSLKGKIELVLNQLPENKIFIDIDNDKQGNFYVTTGNKILKISSDFKNMEYIELPSKISRLNFIAVDYRGILWYGGDLNFPIANYNPSTNEHKLYLIKFNDDQSSDKIIIKGCLIDENNILWLASDGNGVLKLVPPRKKIFSKLSVMDGADRKILKVFPKRIICDDYDNLWITTVNNGIFRYNFTNDKIENFNNSVIDRFKVLDNTGMEIFKDSRGTIWYGGSSRIDTFNYRTNRFLPAFKSGSNHLIYEDSEGFIWTGSNNPGSLLVRHNLKTGTSDNISTFCKNFNVFEGTNVFAFVQESKNLFWIGTDFGLYLLNLEKREIKRYSNDSKKKYSLSNDYISSLLIDSKSRIWVTTRDGINIYNSKDDNFYHINSLNGLSNNFVYGIIQSSDSTFWVSTNKGLNRIIYKNESNFKIRYFEIKDGLQSNEFNTNSYCKCNDGKLLFGGVAGINYFYPDSIQDNLTFPKVVISNIKLFEVDLKCDSNYWALSHLKLSHEENTISFEFAALDYTDPELINYAYKLEGVDGDWVYSKKLRFARYANLKPGKYILKIKSTNSDNIWNDKYRSLEITISESFWKSNIFYLILSIALIITLLGIFRLRTLQINKRNIDLSKEVKESTDKLRTKNIELEAKSFEIIKINAELEQKVANRTLELQNTNLQLQKLLDEVTKSKSESLKYIIKAQEDERARFAKDLHDGTGQFMAFLKFNLSNLKSKLKDNNFDADGFLSEQIKLIDEIVKELRQFAYSLMPPVLERVGLNAALEELVEMHKKTTNIRIDYFIQDRKKMMPRYNKIHIYRIVQEILSNSIKHSNCTKIHFQMLSYPNNILIVIEDNGVGFKPELENTGMGLINIKSRIALINGKIDIDSQLNHGTTITIEVPS